MKIKTEAMYRGRLYQIAEAPEGYLISCDCGKGLGNYDRVAPIKDYEEAVRAVKLEIDRFVDRYVDDILLFGEGIKLGARLYSHETNEKCTVVAFNGSSMTVKFDNGDTQEFGSDYAFDVIYDFKAVEDAQYDIVCEGHTRNGMEFQIVIDDHNKDKGYGYAVDIWPCFRDDYTEYSWGCATITAAMDLIENEYSKDKDKLKYLIPGKYALVRSVGSDKSEVILVHSIDKNTIAYRVPGVIGVHTGDISLIVPLAAEIIPWDSEELQNHVGSLFKVSNIIYTATGYDGNLCALIIPKIHETVYVNSNTLLGDGYEVKTDEGWKPCYHIKWEKN